MEPAFAGLKSQLPSPFCFLWSVSQCQQSVLLVIPPGAQARGCDHLSTEVGRPKSGSVICLAVTQGDALQPPGGWCPPQT